ncbi:MAG: FAD-binding oxidoreductase [Cytophagales bacterium]|nr:FAD-binding oxidoreductase [Cytophagales bacterium]
MVYDYLIVGQGLAGTVLSHTLMKKGKKVMVINQNEEFSSSKVAAGVYNPVTGIRMVKTWLADDLFPFVPKFYGELENVLNTKFLIDRLIYKPFINIEQQNDLIAKSSDKHFKHFLSIAEEKTDEFYTPFVHNELGACHLHQAGNLKIPAMLDSYQNHLKEIDCYQEDVFQHEDLILTEEGVEWKNLKAKKIIFCDGHRATQNPYFDWLEFSLTKGEILLVKIPDFPEEDMVNKGFFILPRGNQEFFVGSSYERKIDMNPTEKARKMLTEKLDNLLKVDYEILEQRVGIRPTVRDRRPFLGLHPVHKQVGIFNGLGTKGVTLAPYFAEHFYEHLENGKELHKEVNILRYYSLA